VLNWGKKRLEDVPPTVKPQKPLRRYGVFLSFRKESVHFLCALGRGRIPDGMTKKNARYCSGREPKNQMKTIFLPLPEGFSDWRLFDIRPGNTLPTPPVGCIVCLGGGLPTFSLLAHPRRFEASAVVLPA
jgi:hypothetical protein